MRTIAFDSDFVSVVEPDNELKTRITELMNEFADKVMNEVHKSQMKRQLDEIPAEFTRITLHLSISDEREVLKEDKI